MYSCDRYVSEEVGVQLISLLLKNSQIEINKRDSIGYTALHIACWYGTSKCAKTLIEDDRIDINVTGNDDETPLYRAVSRSQLNTVKVLLSSSDIDPNILSKGKTPLHRAHEKGDKEIMRELLKDKRTKADIPGNDGKTFIELETDKEILQYAEEVEYYEDFLSM